jgi:hypothetical protein
MKPTIAMLLAVLATPPFARAAETKAPAASDSGLSPLAEKYAQKREALLKEYAAKRRALFESAEWKTLSTGERKARLEALTDEAKARDDRLIADFDAELRSRRAQEDADAAKAEQDRQRTLDELRTRAAQDAQRAKKTP